MRNPVNAPSTARTIRHGFSPVAELARFAQAAGTLPKGKLRLDGRGDNGPSFPGEKHSKKISLAIFCDDEILRQSTLALDQSPICALQFPIEE